MPQPLLCLDEDVRHLAERFRSVFSKPQDQSFVTVLLGQRECEGKHTLSGIVSNVGEPRRLSGLSRFFSEAPWVQEALVVIWQEHVRAEMQPQVETEREQQRHLQPKRRGRPKQPLVTGEVIGDEPTMRKPRGRTMAGLGKHQSTISDPRIVGHRLVQGLSVLLDRTCPLAPQRSRQESVCEAEEMAFQSTIELMNTLIRECEPVAGTLTPILLERWDCATCLWHAARERDVLITTGLTSNRWLRLAEENAPQGWVWQKLSEYVASVTEQDFVHTCWPRGAKPVSVPIGTTSVRTLSRCQIVIVRHSLDAPLSQARYRASSDLEATTETLLTHLSARWDIEVLFGDGKEELGLDHAPLMSASAMLRLWRWLCSPPSSWRKNSSPCKPCGNAQSPVVKLDARSRVAIVAACVSGCITHSFLGFNRRPCVMCSPPHAAQLQSATLVCVWCALYPGRSGPDFGRA